MHQGANYVVLLPKPLYIIKAQVKKKKTPKSDNPE